MSRTSLRFEDLGPSVAQLLSRAPEQRFRAGQQILAAGDRSDAIYVITSGLVAVSVHGDGGRDLQLDPMTPGSYVGELGVLDKRPRSASIEAEQETTVRIIKGDDFRRHLRTHSDVAMNLLRHLTIRIRELSEGSRDFARADAYGLLRQLLVGLPRREGEPNICDNVPTITEMAKRIGVSRERLSKIIGALKEGGFIRLEEGSLHFCRPLPLHAGRDLRALRKPVDS